MQTNKRYIYWVSLAVRIGMMMFILFFGVLLYLPMFWAVKGNAPDKACELKYGSDTSPEVYDVPGTLWNDIRCQRVIPHPGVLDSNGVYRSEFYTYEYVGSVQIDKN